MAESETTRKPCKSLELTNNAARLKIVVPRFESRSRPSLHSLVTAALSACRPLPRPNAGRATPRSRFGSVAEDRHRPPPSPRACASRRKQQGVRALDAAAGLGGIGETRIASDHGGFWGRSSAATPPSQRFYPILSAALICAPSDGTARQGASTRGAAASVRTIP